MRITLLCRGLLLALSSGLSACGATGSDISAGLLGSAGTSTINAQLTLTGPADASPGTERVGFRATLKQSDGTTAIPAQLLTLTSDAGGTFTVRNGTTQVTNASSGTTNSSGQVQFSYTPPSTIVSDRAVRITVTAENIVDASGEPLTQFIDVIVHADTFLFTQPEFGASVSVGTANAESLQFEWRNSQQAGGAAVEGRVCLQADGTGFLITNNDFNSRSRSQSVMTSMASDGDFAVPVSVFSEDAGAVNITAADCSTSARKATIKIQFVDEPCDSGCTNLTVAPSSVAQSPDGGGNQRKVRLTFEVLNERFEPAEGVKITFTLVTRISGGRDEKVFPGGGATDSDGIATSEYFVPASAGTAEVKACAARASGAPVCETRTIKVT